MIKNEACHPQSLYSNQFETPLGQMIAIADQNALYLLEFIEQKGLEAMIKKSVGQAHGPCTPGETPPI